MSDDKTIVHDVLAQTPGAYERLVERHHALVWHIVLRMSGNPDDARDLVQEVFLRVHRKLGQFQFKSQLSTWIGRIAYNVGLRFLERQPPQSVAIENADLASGNPGPEQRAESADVQARVASVIESLPPIPRTVVSLYYLSELSIPHISQLTGLADGTIKSHLHRARARMRKQLDHWEDTI